MLYIELREYSRTKEVRRVFLNGEYPERRLQRELKSYFSNNEEMQRLLEEGNVLTQDLILKISMPTVVETRSDSQNGAFRRNYLYYRDKLILHSDATFDIKCSPLNGIMERMFWRRFRKR